MTRYFLLFLFLFFLCGHILSQKTIAENVQQFTTENGLPSNGIKAMQWDEQTGFLWLATEAGITRFDGVDFKIFTNENTPFIKSQRMWSMVRNGLGNIYTADLAGNIFSIQGNKLKSWYEPEGKEIIYFTPYNLLTVSDSFFIKKNSTADSSLNKKLFPKIVAINDTSCFFFNTNKVYSYSISQQSPTLLTATKNAISTIFKINNTSFLLDTKNNFFILNPSTGAMQPVFVTDAKGNKVPINSKNSLLHWEEGMSAPVFIEKEKAWLLRYNSKTLIKDLLSVNIPTDAFIRSAKYSLSNNLLFIATDSKGLIVIHKNPMLTKKRKIINTKKRNAYYAQIALPNNNILTNEGDIIGDSSNTGIKIPVTGKFNFTVSITGDTLLWYIQQNASTGRTCLNNYNLKTGKPKVYHKIMLSDLAVVAQSQNKIYVSSERGIGLLDSDSLRYLYNNSKNDMGNIIYDMKEIDPGKLAVASCKGLIEFNIKTQNTSLLFNKENYCVRTIWKYKDYLFFGTYGDGFYIMKGNRIKQMPLDKNKYLLYTHCFVLDNKGFCWISTNRGLFKAGMEELIAVFEKNTAIAYYHYFGKKDGMEMTELNGGCTPCALQLNNNIISFPSMDGLLWVNADKAFPILPTGKIFIDEVIVDNEKRDSAYLAKNALPANTEEIIVQLAFSAWCNRENIYLEYQLNDTISWKPVTYTNGAEIKFSNLPNGKYILRIRKLNGFGLNNYSYAEISFSIITAWYKRWWFYLILALTIAGIVIFYFRIRTNQYKIRQLKLEKQVAEKTKELQQKNEVLEKNNDIKTRLISIISHDIVTPLKFVAVAGQNLMAKKELMSEELQQETIKEITYTSQELQLLSTNILNWIKYQNENRRLVKEQFSLYEMVKQVKGILNPLAKQKQLEFENNVSAELQVYQYFEPLKILMYNLLTNAINFSEKSNITIIAHSVNQKLIISVQDKGVGMTTEQIKNIMADQFIISSANIDNRKGNGLGYLIIKDLVKMMGATLHIDSEKGNGTTVSIQFPITNI
jgi:signal transduction histidine kinase